MAMADIDVALPTLATVRQRPKPVDEYALDDEAPSLCIESR